MRGRPRCSSRLTRRALALLLVAAAGGTAGVALGGTRAAHDVTTLTLTTLPVGPLPPRQAPQLTTTMTVSTGAPIATVPFTVTVEIQDGNVELPSNPVWTINFGSGLTVQSVTTTGGACPTTAGLSQY